MNKPSDYEEIYPRPLSGEKVVKLPPALLLPHVSLVGADVTLEPMDATSHAAELFEASHGAEEALGIRHKDSSRYLFARIAGLVL